MKYLPLLCILLLTACHTEEIVPDQLYWYQPRLAKRQFELKKNDQVVATLVWSWSSATKATFQENGQEWRFQQPNWFKNQICIQNLATGQEIGRFQPRGFFKNGYDLELNGVAYQIFFRPYRIVLCDSQGNQLTELARADNRRKAVKGMLPTDNMVLAVLRYLQQIADDASDSANAGL